MFQRASSAIPGSAAADMKMWFGRFLIAFWFSVFAASAQPRVAIVTEDASREAAADILTTQFTKENQVTLIERDQIQKVYREQALSAGNTDYLRLGQILGADGLLLLRASSEGTNQFLSARVVAVKPGVVLVSEKFLWPITNLVDWSSAFAGHLRRFLPKLTVLEKDAVPISVINLRSAVSSADGLEVERQLKFLTLDRLSRETRLFVLERQKMELLSEENQLKGLDDSSFWGASYLLDGVIDRDGYTEDKTTIDARLTPPRGGAPIEIKVNGNRNDLAGLTDDLAKKIVTALNLKSTVSEWNAAEEAEQFFAEAKWASRWGLFNEAQVASESAWALGLKTRDLAALRIWAYADQVDVLSDSAGNLFLPAYPDEAKLPEAIRAVNLFCENASLLLTNSAGLNDVVFREGVHVFRVALTLLDGFYMNAELRQGNEDSLAELRRGLQHCLPLLDSQARLVSIRSISFQELNIYNLAKWEEGGVVFERPEDSLAMFQQMLEAGYSATELPRIVGWSWTDRKRVPEIIKQFIAKMSASTNAALCLRGYCLSMVKTAYYPEATFHAQEQALVDAMWNHRDWIFSSADNAALLGDAEDILREKYGQSDLYAPFREEPFASLKQNLRKEFLTSRTKFDPQVVGALFPSSYAVASAEQAQELLPLMDKLPKTNWEIKASCNNIRRIAGSPPQNVRPAPPKPIMPAQEPIVARFISWNGIASSAGPYARAEIEHMILRDGQLWAEIAFLQPNEFLPFAMPPATFAAINLKSGESETVPAREKLGPLGSDFEVTKDSIYVSVRDHLERYRRREKTWESLAVPVSGVRQIVEFGGKLYVSTFDSLLEVTPDSGSVQILASGRRTPPVNELDSVFAEGGGRIVKTENRLFLNFGERAFIFVPTNQTWRPLPTRSISQPGWQAKEYFSDAGELFFSPGMMTPKRYTASWLDTASPQFLLKQDVERETTDTKLDQLLGPPCWDWPKPFYLEYPCVLAEGKSFWMLHPRKPEIFFRRQEEPVIFKDDRDVTLLHFEPGRREAMAVPLRFEKDGAPINPFDRKQLAFVPGPDTPTPLCFLCPDGLIICCQKLMGHWLIQRSEIEKRQAPLIFETPKTGGSPP